MTILMIGVLMLLSGYLGLRLNATKSENSVLRANVASLKRQLQRG
jgi:hypothetical protein